MDRTRQTCCRIHRNQKQLSTDENSSLKTNNRRPYLEHVHMLNVFVRHGLHARALAIWECGCGRNRVVRVRGCHALTCISLPMRIKYVRRRLSTSSMCSPRHMALSNSTRRDISLVSGLESVRVCRRGCIDADAHAKIWMCDVTRRVA